MESGEAMVFLDRASRMTRGKRMNKLVDEENEDDDQFWNQDALKEEEIDDNYEEEREVADEFDSDFNEDESEPDEAVDNEKDARVRTKKRLVYPGKPPSKKKKTKVLTKLESIPIRDENNDDVPEEEKVVRKSTRTSVIVRQAEREAIQAAIQATMRPIKRRKEGEEKKWSQEEMLLDAAQTEIMNLRNLERVLAREEEVKKRAVVLKTTYAGPQIRYISKDGCSYLEFINGASFESNVSTSSDPYPEKAVCAVTGLPAKYRDPKTGLPYATKEAFKIIRERYLEENCKKDMEMGNLLDSISGHGFLARGRRSVASNRSESSYFRYLARFRRIPALEDQLSE